MRHNITACNKQQELPSFIGSPRVGPDFGKGPDHVGPAAAGISPSFMCDPTPDPIPQCGGAVKASHASLTSLLQLTKPAKPV
jgi:hypothetical protein